MTVSIPAALPCLHEATMPDLRDVRSGVPGSTGKSHVMGLRLSPVPSGPYSHYSEWVEICPIVKGRVQLTSVHALNIKGRDEECPLGVAPGEHSAARHHGACLLLETSLCCQLLRQGRSVRAARDGGPVSSCCDNASSQPCVRVWCISVLCQRGGMCWGVAFGGFLALSRPDQRVLVPEQWDPKT